MTQELINEWQQKYIEALSRIRQKDEYIDELLAQIDKQRQIALTHCDRVDAILEKGF